MADLLDINISLAEIAKLTNTPMRYIPQRDAGNYNACVYNDRAIYVWGENRYSGHTSNAYGLKFFPGLRLRFEGNYLEDRPNVTISQVVDCYSNLFVLLSDGTLWYIGQSNGLSLIGGDDLSTGGRPANAPDLGNTGSFVFFIRMRWDPAVFPDTYKFKSIYPVGVCKDLAKITIGAIVEEPNGTMSTWMWGYNPYSNWRTNPTSKTIMSSIEPIKLHPSNVAPWNSFTGTNRPIFISPSLHSVSDQPNGGSTLILTSNNRLLCIGTNTSGQLGLGHKTDVKNWTIHPLTNVDKIFHNSMSGVFNRFVRVTTSGDPKKLYVTGDNSAYQCGNNTNTDVLTFTKVNFGTGTALEVEDLKTCGYYNYTTVVARGKAIIDNIEYPNAVFTWGYNVHGQCGVGITANNIKTPQRVTEYLTIDHGATGTQQVTKPLPQIAKIKTSNCRQEGAVALIDFEGNVYVAGYSTFGPVTLNRTGVGNVSTTTYRRFEKLNVADIVDVEFYDNRDESKGMYMIDKKGAVYVVGYSPSGVNISGQYSDINNGATYFGWPTRVPMLP